MLSTPMAIGGITAAFFDNILPGTLEDRGLTTWRLQKKSTNKRIASLNVYDLPLIQDYLNKWKWIRYVPFLPYHETNTSNKEQNGVEMTLMSP